MSHPAKASGETATLWYYDNTDASTAGFGGPFGTVTTTIIDSNTLQIEEDLDSAYKIHTTLNDQHNAFVFNVDKAFSFVAGSLTPGFTALLSGPGNSYDAPPFNAGGFGWNSAIACYSGGGACGPGGGWGDGYAGPLSFEIYSPTGLSIADLKYGAIFDGVKIIAASDLITQVCDSSGSNCQEYTGNVGAPGPAPGVGLAGLAFLVLAGAMTRARGFLAR